jgi:hypothetical protein
MQPTYPEVEISNGRIRAAVYLPDPDKGFYRGTRFDWSGVIGQLEYEGHNYYGPWFDHTDPTVHDFVYRDDSIVAGPCSAVTGPVEEFSTKGKALGYDDAPTGGSFLKIGVGVLRKPQEPDYDEYRLYELVDPGDWTVRNAPARVEFVQVLTSDIGFAYEYRKTVRLAADKPEMVLEHELINRGRRPIRSSVYNHNFLVLDGQAPGPDFQIVFPFEIRTHDPPAEELAAIRGREFVYEKQLKNQECASACLEGFGAKSEDYDIRIGNSRIRAGMRITGDCPIERLSLWSIRSVLSIEPFVAIDVQPDSAFGWKLAYTFYTL